MLKLNSPYSLGIVKDPDVFISSVQNRVRVVTGTIRFAKLKVYFISFTHHAYANWLEVLYHFVHIFNFLYSVKQI